MRQDDKDTNKRYFRSSDRVFHMNDGWYFASREGDIGPFVSERMAHDEVDRFLSERRELASFQCARDARAEVGPSASSLALVPLDERTTHRPAARPLANYKVMI